MVIPDAVTPMTGLSRVLASACALSYVPGSVEWADFDPAATATAITTTDAPQRLPAAALAVGAGPRDITPGQPLLGPLAQWWGRAGSETLRTLVECRQKCRRAPLV